MESRQQRYRNDASDLLRKPLVGDDGVNPFADPQSAAKCEARGEQEGAAKQNDANEGAANNLYAAPAQRDGQPSTRRPEYVATLVSRSRRILIFGIAGLFGSVIFLAFFNYMYLSFEFPFVLPLTLVNLVFTLGAIVMGYHELKAMAAGVIVGGNRTHVVTGIILGVLATPVSLIGLAQFIYLMSPYFT